MMSKGIKATCIVSLSALVYGFTLQGEFVFDDSEAILKNPDVTGGPLSGLLTHDFWGSNISSNYSHKSYRPLTVLTYRLNYHLNGNILDAAQFKSTNLLCHIVCCLLVWQTYRLLLAGRGGASAEEASFLAALLFVAHPVHVEAVVGAVGRADLLAAIFYFLAFWSYYWSCRMDTNGMRSCVFLVCTVILAALSMVAKENGVTVLGVCLVYEITIIRKLDVLKYLYNFYYARINQKPPKLKSNKLMRSTLRIVVMVASTMMLLAVRWWVMSGSGPYFQPSDNPAAFSDSLLTRILTYQYIYFLNILLLIWPQWLCFDWSMGCIPLLESLSDPRVICIAFLYLYMAISLVYVLNQKVSWKHRRLVLMCASLTVVPFLPAANVLLTVGFVLAERVLYLPSAGYCLMLSLGLRKLIAFDKRKFSKLFYWLYGIVLVSFSLKSWQRSRDWQTEYKLFTAGLEVCPGNAKVHYNIAKVADVRNETDYAVKEYREAIRLFPKYYQAMNNLANLLKDHNNYTEAEYYLREAIKHKADFPAAWMNLAILLANTRRLGESRDAYLTALTYRHNYPDCYYNLGNLYLEMQLKEQAVESWRRAISLNPSHRLAWSNLLAFLDNTGQTSKALDLIPVALSALPESHSIHFITANILGKIGKFEEAEKHFLKTITLSGSQVQAIHYANLGVLYHRWKRYVKAEEMYQKALQINPQLKSAQDNLSAVRKTIKKLN